MMTANCDTVEPLRVLVVDDEASIRATLGLCLEADGHAVTACGTLAEAHGLVGVRAFDLIFLDIRLGADNGLDLIPIVQRQCPLTRIIVITAYASVETAVIAMKQGATDYLPKPFTPTEVGLVTRKVAERRKLEWRIEELQANLGAADPEADFPTRSAAMQSALDLARRIASSNANVLIIGEPGTGKSRLARAIHTWSTRAAAPYGICCCESTSADELEAGLFGTAAVTDPTHFRPESAGRLAFCDGGTLLLEELGQFPPSLHLKLARLLRDKSYERFDDFHERHADVRLRASSSFDLDQLAKRGRFRPELLLAVDVVRIEIPPLRQRVEDIHMLAHRYLAFFGRQNHRSVDGIAPDAIRVLEKHRWPGNSRDLRNVIERAVLICDANRIEPRHLPSNLLGSSNAVSIGDLVPLEQIEDQHIGRVLEATGSIKGAAEVLDLDASTVQRWIRRNSRTREAAAQRAQTTQDAATSPSIGEG